MRDFNHSLLLSAALGVVLMMCAFCVYADYKQDYARGLEAAADADWNEVEKWMRKSLQESATPLKRTRLYGQRFAPYIPQYYLGLAAFQRNDCDETLHWFNDPEALKIIMDNDQFKSIAERSIKSCKARMAVTTVPQNTESGTSNDIRAMKIAPAPSFAENHTLDEIPLASKAPIALQQLALDFMTGRFSRAATSDISGLAGKARFHALLLRSAARYAMYEMQPDTTLSQKAGAESDIRLAKALEPDTQPDPAHFSPRFRKFFSEVR